MLFDTHVNLHADQFADDLPDVISRARAAGVDRMICISDKLENFPAIRSIVETDPQIWCSVGAHPHYAKDHRNLESRTLIEQAEWEPVCGIGETGLDQHYGYSDLDDQLACFEKHIEAAQETGLPLIVHTREADAETGDALEQAAGRKSFPLLMHCYTSGETLARRAIDLDAYFSVSGILSFKNAHDVRDVIATVPRERVILETDCPYLAPVPMRGRRNEPSFLPYVRDALATLWETTPEETTRITTENALRLFGRVR